MSQILVCPVQEIPGKSSLAGLFSRAPPSQIQIKSEICLVSASGGSPRILVFLLAEMAFFHCGIRPPSGTLRSVRSCMLSCWYDDFTYDVMRFELSPKKLVPADAHDES